MRSFDDTLELMRIELEQSEGALILVSICDDTALRDHTIKELRQRLSPHISLRDFHHDPEHLSLLEAAVENLQSGNGRVALSVTGLEELPHDKWSEAIKLLNLQRNRFGYTGAAVILWVNRATHAEIANKSADFFSWRSGTFIIEPPPGWDTLKSARRSYLQALIAQNEFVNLQGLAPMRGGQLVQMRMDEIFVPLRAEHEVREMGPHSLFPDDLSEEEARGDGDNRTPRQRMRRTEDTKEADSEREARRAFLAGERQQVESRTVEVAEMLKDRHAVVLGDPGAGKTTLLRYLTYLLAKARLGRQAVPVLESHAELRECLPVYVRIGEYAQHCRFHPETTIDAFALTSAQARHLPLSQELFKHEMEENRVVFLLDGLDEITTSDDRRTMTGRIEEFIRTHLQRRVIVTSRVVGYREAPLGLDFAQFTIRPFEDDDIRQFVAQWYAALHEPDSAVELTAAILGNPSVRRLAANPLLLTVIALIHRRLAKLPQQRAKLYSLAAETLVDQWMTQRRVIPEGWDIQETVQALLPAVAWHLHATTASGLIGEQALHDLLVDTLRQQDSYLREDEAHRRAAQFRRNVSEFSGIFLDRGLDQEGRGLYGFLHLTFEEYFAAVRLADKWEREGKTALTPLLHDPRWTEVILLTAGSLSESRQYRATEFVKAVQSARSQYELILHRDLLLAARCLADDVRIDAAVRRGLVEKLLKLAFDKRSPNALREDLSRIFSRFAGVAAAKDLVQALLRCLTDDNEYVRGAAMETFGQLGASVATPEVVQALLRCLTDDNEYVRGAAVETFGQLGASVATPEVVQALLRALTDAEWHVRGAAVQTFGQLGASVATPEVVQALPRALTDAEEYVRQAAVQTFGQLGASVATPEVVQALLRCLTDDNKNVRRAAVQTFGQLGASVATPEVVQALPRALTDAEEYVRQAAVQTFGQLGASMATPEVVQALLRCLTDDNKNVRRAAVQTFGQLGASVATPEVVQVLLRALTDAEEYVRGAAVETFGQLGASVATPEVVQALLRALTDAEWHVRGAAVQTFGQLGASVATPEVVQALLRFLTDAEEYVRGAAVETFGQLRASVATPEVVQALLRALTDAEGNVRGAAVGTFGQLGASVATPEVVQALLRALTDAEGNVRGAAVGTFGQLGASVATPEVVQALLSMLTDSNRDVRGTVAWTFGRLGASITAAEVVQALLSMLTDSNKDVRRAAVETFGWLGPSVASAEVMQALLHALKDAEWNVRRAAVVTLKILSNFIRLADWPEAPSVFVPLARSRNREEREVGYVCLRNLLAGEQESTLET